MFVFLYLDQSYVPIKIKIDPFEYKHLVTSCLPIINENEHQIHEYNNVIYENDDKIQQFESNRDNQLEYLNTIPEEQDLSINNSYE